MDNDAFDAADVPLLFAVRYLIREYRNCITTLQAMLDENRDLFVPLPNDHPVALGIPLPHALSSCSAQTLLRCGACSDCHD